MHLFTWKFISKNANVCFSFVLTGLIMSAGATSMVHTSAVANGPSAAAPKTITLDTMNPHIKTMEYAVRGPLVIRKLISFY